MNAVSVLLVSDNSPFLCIATRFLQQNNGMTVVGTAGGGEEALVQARELQPQVIVLDLAMSALSGLETIPLLRTALPEAGIIVVTLLDTSSYRAAALTAGADVFVSKTKVNTELLRAIRQLTQT
jgi:DNA-binding NarL/FixJ family response regulator